MSRLLRSRVPSRWRRRRVALLLAATLGFAAVGLTSTPALAQNEPPPAEGEDTSGRPLDGYLATGCMAGLALFLIAKSARRQVGR